jgi:hypothetical protein
VVAASGARRADQDLLEVEARLLMVSKKGCSTSPGLALKTLIFLDQGR